MSHQPERKEKACLNCGATVLGRYCHVCGQENVETKESFLSLVKHFVYDILHFDGKFWDTLKYILFRPGYISKQYVEGKRARFLHPIRMYLFTSAVFFLIFFSISGPGTGIVNLKSATDTLTAKDRQEMLAEVRDELANRPGDSLLLKQLNRLQDTALPIRASELLAGKNRTLVNLDDNITTLQQYDSLQQALPAAERDGWFEKQLKRRGLAVNSKYSGRSEEGFREFLDLLLHKLPYLLFLSLPFFALILKLLYIRRKHFFYSDHAVFTLHHYIFSFILLLLVILLGRLSDWTQLQVFQKLTPFLMLLWPVYLLIAMKNFYGQGWGRTFSKFLLLNLLGVIVLLLLFVIFLFFTFFQL